MKIAPGARFAIELGVGSDLVERVDEFVVQLGLAHDLEHLFGALVTDQLAVHQQVIEPAYLRYGRCMAQPLKRIRIALPFVGVSLAYPQAASILFVV